MEYNLQQLLSQRLYDQETGITREYTKALFGVAARIRSSHEGEELWRYRICNHPSNVYRTYDYSADSFDSLDEFIEYIEKNRIPQLVVSIHGYHGY